MGARGAAMTGTGETVAVLDVPEVGTLRVPCLVAFIECSGCRGRVEGVSYIGDDAAVTDLAEQHGWHLGTWLGDLCPTCAGGGA